MFVGLGHREVYQSTLSTLDVMEQQIRDTISAARNGIATLYGLDGLGIESR